MRAAVYNRWLNTMGGGERHSCMAASVLTDTHAVDLVTHRDVDREELGERLNVDLSKVNLRVIPALPPNRFIEFTRDYQLFVNASFMSSQPSAAQKNMMLVLFPSPVDHTGWARIRRAIGLIIIQKLGLPEYLDGFYDVQELGRGWFRYASDKARVRLRVPHRARPITVDIRCGNFRPTELGDIRATCEVDSETVGTTRLKPDKGTYVRWQLEIPAALIKSAALDIDIRSDAYNPQSDLGQDDNRNIGLAISDVGIASLRHQLYDFVFRRLAPQLGLRLEGLHNYGSLEFLDSYQLICPISEFSLHWMRQYWKRDGPILYPPVAVADHNPGCKHKIILSVGRFFGEGGHPKNHEFMIRSFEEMLHDGLEDWELHLAGNRGTRPVDERYFNNLQKATDGIPVILHPNLPFSDLKRLYKRSSIYWHASGFGQNPKKKPINFEHFGITTIEAMASGCVPVVIKNGGQPELVNHKVDGLLWSSQKELMRFTFELIANPRMLTQLSQKAVSSAERFGEDRFRRHFLELVDSIP